MHLNSSFLIIFIPVLTGCNNSHALIDDTGCTYEKDSYEILLDIKDDPRVFKNEIFIKSLDISYISRDTVDKSDVIDFFGYSEEDGQKLEGKPRGKWCTGKLGNTKFTTNPKKLTTISLSFSLINNKGDQAVMLINRKDSIHLYTALMYLQKDLYGWKIVDEQLTIIGTRADAVPKLNDRF